MMRLALFVLLSMNAVFAANPRVLYIGDSHTTGAFGAELDRLMRTLPSQEVATYGSCGSAPIHWNTSWGKTYNTKCGYYEHVLNGKPV